MMNTKTIISALALGSLSVATAFAVDNYGLRRAQPQDMLPKAKAAPQTSQRKPFAKTQNKFVEKSHNSFALRDGWTMFEEDCIVSSPTNIFADNFSAGENEFNATVPGTILQTLVDSGVYPNPYYGLNNFYIPDTICRKNWFFRTEFELGNLANKGENIQLVINGINYKADIWLNGKKLGQTKGAFIRGYFDITNIVNKSGKNVLAIRVCPPPNVGIAHEESDRSGQGPNGGTMCLDGPTFICSEGWDWIPTIRDRNSGIWRDIEIKFTNSASIGDAFVKTDLNLPECNLAKISASVPVSNKSNAKKTFTVKCTIDGKTLEKSVSLKANESEDVEFEMQMQNPKLWWPNNMGEQNLYFADISVSENGVISDKKLMRFGVREISYLMMVDLPEKNGFFAEFNPIEGYKNKTSPFDNSKRREVADRMVAPKVLKDANLAAFTPSTEKTPYLIVKINGKKVFVKGGNWGIDDAMKRISREKLIPYFELQKRQNFNIIRNWTGETTQEEFYELCDEYGMLVWNDFWSSTQNYNLRAQDEALFVENAKDVVLRYRNHPSIVFWCPKNEGYVTEELNADLAKLIAEYDGTRYYIPNSRFVNMRTSGPYRYFKDAAFYYGGTSRGFNTEIGSFSIPTAETVRSFIPKEDLWPVSDTWVHHDLHNGHFRQEYYSALEDDFGKKSKNEAEFCAKAQVLNYESYRAMFEGRFAHLWDDTTGLMLWMSHPAWPSMTWQTYSWDYETTGAYFGTMKACQPIHIQMNLSDFKVVAVNNNFESMPDITVSAKVYSAKGELLWQKSQKATLLANDKTETFKVEFPENLNECVLIRTTLEKSGQILAQNDYWKNPKNPSDRRAMLKVGKPELAIDGKIKENKKNGFFVYEFTLKNKSAFTASSVKLNARNAKDERILPAYFSDGFFNLLPNESVKILVEIPEQKNVGDIHFTYETLTKTTPEKL